MSDETMLCECGHPWADHYVTERGTDCTARPACSCPGWRASFPPPASAPHALTPGSCLSPGCEKPAGHTGNHEGWLAGGPARPGWPPPPPLPQVSSTGSACSRPQRSSSAPSSPPTRRRHRSLSAPPIPPDAEARESFHEAPPEPDPATSTDAEAMLAAFVERYHAVGVRLLCCPDDQDPWALRWQRTYLDGVASDEHGVWGPSMADVVRQAEAWEAENDKREPEYAEAPPSRAEDDSATKEG